MNSLKTSYNAEITEIERKIPGVTSLSTTSALNAVEKDIQRQWSDQEGRLWCKVKRIEIKYFNTSDYNK